METRYKVGDIIAYKRDNAIVRQIVKVYKKHYLWRYYGEGYTHVCPNGQENLFSSNNSNDPEMQEFELVSTWIK